MHILKHFCREHRITQKRALWLGLIIFGDDIIVILIITVFHYLQAGGGAGM